MVFCSVKKCKYHIYVKGNGIIDNDKTIGNNILTTGKGNYTICDNCLKNIIELKENYINIKNNKI